MTTTTAPRHIPVIDARGARAATGFAGPLMAAHAEAGALLAELMERSSGSPLVPLLAADVALRARQAAGLAAGGPSQAAGGLSPDPSAPAVVWAREVASAQRLLRRALSRGEGSVDDGAAEQLSAEAREMRVLVRELAALTRAVG